MLHEDFQKPFYLSSEESEQIKTAIQADILELESFDTSSLTHKQNVHVEIAQRALRSTAEIDHLNAEQATVRKNVRRNLFAQGIEMSALPEGD